MQGFILVRMVLFYGLSQLQPALLGRKAKRDFGYVKAVEVFNNI